VKFDEKEQESEAKTKIPFKTRKYNLYVDGEDMRSLIDRWCQSTKYVAEIHKQDLLFYHIIDKIESSATAPQSVFKDRWTDLINVMEDIFTPSNIDPNEKQDVKIYIKELMKKVITWEQLDNVIKIEKNKLRTSKYE
ncbi:19905_t:CDS:2, partial [Entrophospora sp. SA101]